MWPLKSLLYFILFWIACLLALFNPIWGVINYLLVYQTNPTNTWWGAPLEAAGMRFSMLTAVFTLLGLLFGRRHIPSVRPLVSLWDMGVLAILVAACLSLFVGVSYNHRSTMAIEKLWKMLLFVLILARLGGSRRNLRWIIWSLVAGSLYVGYDAYTAHPSEFLLGRLDRIGGPDFSTTSGTASHLSAMLPLIGAAFLISHHWMWKVFAAVSGAFAVNAVVMCRTRSAFIGLAVGGLAAVLMAPAARRLRVYALLLVGCVAAFALTDGHYWDRMKTLTDRQVLENDAAAVSRTEIWGVSLRILADHPQGIGLGNFARVIGAYEPKYAKRSTHNTVVVCFVELGIAGGMAFLWLVASSFTHIYRSVRLADATAQPLETRFLTYGILVAFVTYFVAGLGTERFYCESYWWVLALPVCLYRMAVQEAAAQGSLLDAPERLEEERLTPVQQVSHEF